MSEATGGSPEQLALRLGDLRRLTNDESSEIPDDILVGLDALKLTYEQMVCTRQDRQSQSWQAVAIAGPLIVVAETSLRNDRDPGGYHPQHEVTVAAYPLSAVQAVELLGVEIYRIRPRWEEIIQGYRAGDWRLTIDGRTEPVNLPWQQSPPTAEFCIQLLQRIAVPIGTKVRPRGPIKHRQKPRSAGRP
jgi:hypothetical protein